MLLKRLIFLIITLLCVSGANAQKNLVFEHLVHDFGTIREEGGVVAHRFVAKNCSEKPLVLLNVVASCRCVKVEFQRKPILPGGKTEVVVRYDPRNHSGAFSKDVGVYTSDRSRAATLTVAGVVEPRARSVEERFSIDAGEGLRLSTTLVSFSYLYIGHEVHAAVGYANTTDKPLNIELRPRMQSPEARLSVPKTIAPHEEGSFDFAYLVPSSAPRYGTLRDVWEVWVNGKNHRAVIVAHGLIVDNPRDMDKKLAPKGIISENILKFVVDKQESDVLIRNLTLENEANGVLKVRAVEHASLFSTDLKAGDCIKGGEKRLITISLDPRKCDLGHTTERLIILTNDPVRPMIRVRLVVAKE